jgi:hypothetical protein
MVSQFNYTVLYIEVIGLFPYGSGREVKDIEKMRDFVYDPLRLDQMKTTQWEIFVAILVSMGWSTTLSPFLLNCSLTHNVYVCCSSQHFSYLHESSILNNGKKQ